MLAIRLYNIETGHLETLLEAASEETARRWLDTFLASGVGTNEVAYLTELPDLSGTEARARLSR